MTAETLDTIAIPAGRGAATRLAAGDSLRVIDTHGGQCVDTWFFADDGSGEFMRLETCREGLASIFCAPGDVLVTDGYRPIVEVVEDTSPGRHDTLCPACCEGMYLQAGRPPGHRNCTANLQEALTSIAMAAPAIAPQPWNLFMLAPVDANGGLKFVPPQSRAGDFVQVKALMDCVAVFSACPDDVFPTNGAGGPVGAHFQVLPAGT